MSKTKTPKKHLYDITPASAITELNTSALFHADYIESTLSPIDQFIENSNKINIMLENHNGPISDAIGSMILLGYMSAVESYLRALFRGIINIDEVAQKKVESLTVTFAAAMHHTKPLMPEALLESVSLSSKSNIIDCINKIIGIPGIQDRDFVKALDEFSKIVEIRHCCVHRFGKLGSQNAQKLGLSDHSNLLEKPFQPDSESLSIISNSLRSIVHSINSTIFKKLLDRLGNSAQGGEYSFSLTWNLVSDKKYFKPYYQLFASTSSSNQSLELNAAYNEFRNVYKPK